MTRDDIIRMAQEAGVWIAMTGSEKEKQETELERFAALVAAAEREECAKIIEDAYYTCPYDVVLALKFRANAIRARGNHD